MDFSVHNVRSTLFIFSPPHTQEPLLSQSGTRLQSAPHYFFETFFGQNSPTRGKTPWEQIGVARAAITRCSSFSFSSVFSWRKTVVCYRTDAFCCWCFFSFSPPENTHTCLLCAHASGGSRKTNSKKPRKTYELPLILHIFHTSLVMGMGFGRVCLRLMSNTQRVLKKKTQTNKQRNQQQRQQVHNNPFPPYGH